MKYRDCRNKIITFILALFFLGYYAGTSMCYHHHIEDGREISHSHPFSSRSHTHTNSQLQLISFLSLVVMTVPVTAGLLSRNNFLSAIFLSPAIFSIPVADRPVCNLRAPPVI
ncbi:MAG: hypothetical protein PHE35_08870 [Bacteroidales bacterium]|nr:hypothetical protein [Bacteroidales bacterium]MDD2771668.1 hypothetical protein [Bacteroidales bacterium]MDD3105993.1 hypothetical protein [Bacteroidales bacterium]MDD4501348.1 hypothetical protein [Bacteroidales bacterium]MDD5284065.1 hypothetical protein [Bacteroidales bacterium]